MAQFSTLMIIPPDEVLRSPNLVEQCLAAEAGGATAIQIRGKNWSAGPLQEVTHRVVSAASIPVFVNDRIDVAVTSGATGVHLGADDFPVALIEAAVVGPLRVGLSVGSASEARRAKEGQADYWSIGPFFETGSKRDAGAALGAPGFATLAALAPADVAVIAIGGVTPDNAFKVVRAGAVGIAVIHAVFGLGSVETNTRVLRQRLDEAMVASDPES